MQVFFWGTRGSLPMNTPDHRQFGGNTSCVSLTAGDSRIILDAGSGLIHAGAEFMAGKTREIDICFSHFHSDHICGLPFFKPFFDPSFTVRLHSFGINEATLHDAVDSYLSRPIFPITLADFQAEVQFIHHDEHEEIDIGAFTLSSMPIPHPGGAHALKARAGGKTFVYATDTEHVPGTPNQDLIAFMRQADMAIYDCTFEDHEFEARRGWGHSTWQEGIRLAKAAEVKKFGIFHHEPERNDTQLLAIEKQAQADLPISLVTRDFLQLDI